MFLKTFDFKQIPSQLYLEQKLTKPVRVFNIIKKAIFFLVVLFFRLYIIVKKKINFHFFNYRFSILVNVLF